MAGRSKTKKTSASSSRGASSRRKSTGRPSAARKNSRQRSVEENGIPDSLFTEIGILFLLAFCIILILGNFGLTLRFGDVFNSIFFGLFGGMEYIFPFFLFAGVIIYLINKENISAMIKLAAGTVLFFDAGMFLQLFVTDDYNLGGYSGTYDYSMSNRSGGGVLSGGLFEVLCSNIGKPATVMIMIIVLLLCLLILTGNSLLKMLSYSGSEIYDRAKESREEREKDRAAIREERAMLKAEERERRSAKRALDREKKRKKYREDSLNKKRNRDIVNLTVFDENPDIPEEDTSFLQNDVFSYEHDLRQNKDTVKKEEESQGYSPFAMDPVHMIKPKDYDKKREVNEVIPEVRLEERAAGERTAALSEAAERAAAEREADKREAAEREAEREAAEREAAEREAANRAAAEREAAERAAAEKEAAERAAAEREAAEKEAAENRFYEELMQYHETEKSDMHEITFDEDIPEEFLISGGKEKDEIREPGMFYDDPEELTETEDEGRSEEIKVPYEPEVKIKPEDLDEPEDFEDLEEPEVFDEPEDFEDPEEPEDFDEPEDLEDFEDPEDFDDLEDIDNPGDPHEPEEIKEKPAKPYELPPINLLRSGKAMEKDSEDSLKSTAMKLQNILSSFGVRVRMLNYIQGPTVTRFEMQPEQGVKVNTILNLSNDIQMNLAARDIRIEAPIPGKAAVGIEIPNKTNSPVMLRELIESAPFKNAASKITIAVGKDIGGEAVVYDIDKMPHLLIAGATGSGKSVCINTIIMSILYKAKPDEVKLIMIDPKVVELSIYNGIPHLLTPVVTDPVKAAGALNWGVAEMMKRYQLFARVHVRNMEGYNEKVPELNRNGETLIDGSPYELLPQIVIIVDELADLMMVQKKDVEASICRLAQLARAAGIHLIIATQRPSVDVITGLIKANMPSRVAFAVSSNVDSRTILDSAGAEKLLGNGDMLFYPQKYPRPERLQGAFVSDDEVQAVTDFIRNEAPKEETDKDISAEIDAAASSGNSDRNAGEDIPDPLTNDDGRDAYFADAGRFVTEKKKATIGVLQRMFRIGFNRAARIMDQLAEAGVVSGEDGTKPRQVLMTKEEFEAFLENGNSEREADDED